METLSQLKELGKKGALKKEQFSEIIEQLIRKTIEEQTKGYSK